jgi:phage tail-like protein
MAVLREKPYPGMNFTVDLGTGDIDTPDAGLSEVIFPDARLHLLEYRNGNDRTTEVRTLQTTTKYGTLILRRGAIGSLRWYSWWDAARNGDQTVARTIIVALLNEDRTEQVLTWKFLRARPVNHHFSTLSALGTEPLVETLEIVFDRLEME